MAGAVEPVVTAADAEAAPAAVVMAGAVEPVLTAAAAAVCCCCCCCCCCCDGWGC